jgi:hypothetical protein
VESHEAALPFAMVPIEAAQDGRLTLTQLRVLLALLSFRNRKTDLIFPSRDELAKRSGVRFNKVSVSITELIHFGWLVRTHRDGTRTSSVFQVTVPEFLTKNAIEALGVRNDKKASASLPEDPDLGTSATLPEDPDLGTSATLPEVPESGTSEVPKSGTSAKPSHEQTKEEQKRTPFSPLRCKTPSRFAEFWAAWPSSRKINRKKALEVWERRRLDDRADELIADVIRRKTTDRQWLDGFNPSPTTYLNGDRWEDELQITSPIGGVNGSSRNDRPSSAAERGERLGAENRARMAAHGITLD